MLETEASGLRASVHSWRKVCPGWLGPASITGRACSLSWDLSCPFNGYELAMLSSEAIEKAVTAKELGGVFPLKIYIN